MNKVVHIKKDIYDVYIGRPRNGLPLSFGNPFVIGVDGDRNEVIDKYEIWIRSGENFGNKNATEENRKWVIDSLPTIQNCTLGCFCAPLNCHGNVLIQLLQEQGL